MHRLRQRSGTLNILRTGNINAMNSYVTLQPIERWHLYSNYINGTRYRRFFDYVKMFSIIGLLGVDYCLHQFY